jgi:glyoxylase-like metal-dependent hydrolase (beta-lactamase superfamily II)
MKPQVKAFFDKATSSFSYIVYKEEGGACAIIDAVLNYDPRSAHTSSHSADEMIRFMQEHRLSLNWILETHVHADHFSAAHYLQSTLGGKIAIGAHIEHTQRLFNPFFYLQKNNATPENFFNVLLHDNQTFSIGELTVTALHVPGHTPCDIAYHIEDTIFVGDTLFMPNLGTARCDFPGGNPATLYKSIQRILSFPDHTRLFMCHDYPDQQHIPQCESSVGEQRTHNIHVREGISEADFIAMRTQRDTTLELPALILPSLQINLRAGQFPPPDANGISYLKIPLNTF